MTRRSELLGLFLLSAAALCYELLLMRIFSVLMWYHFASLAIGLALLGMGGGGALVGAARPLRRHGAGSWGAALFGTGVLAVLGALVAVHTSPTLARGLLAPFHQPFYQPFARLGPAAADLGIGLRVAALAVAAGLPFLAAGTAVAATLTRAAPHIAQPYAATFLGSAAGCLAAPALLGAVSAPAALGAAAAAGLLAAAVFRPRRDARRLFLGGALLACATGAWVELEGAAEIPFARGRYVSRLLAVEWNAMSRVAAFPLAEGEARRAFGLSPSYRGPVPPQIGLVVDDSGYTNLFQGAAAREHPDYFRSNLVSLPYHLVPEADALLLGPGGGKDVWIALSFPGTRVHAVEINPLVVEMVEERFAPFTGRPYADPRVQLTISDGRRFAALDRHHYDVISASAVFGRQPPAAGAFTLSEDWLHTREAFQDYWRRLSPRGILSITRFAYERRALRLVALARTLLDAEGVADPGAHVRVLSDRGLANVMISRRPFTPAQDEVLADLARELGFRTLYPDSDGPTLLTRLLEAEPLSALLKETDFDVSPPTDDRPFFYYTLRPRDFLRGTLPDGSGFDDRGAEILRAAALVLLGLTLAALILPPLIRRDLPAPGWGAAVPLLYAAALGFGYMAVEIGTLKRLVLFLGHPMVAASAALFGFLVGGGLGSLWAGRVVASRTRLAAVLALAAGLAAGQALFVPGLVERAFALATAWRWLLAAGLILPLACVLGAAFPAGMRLLGPPARSYLPWAWTVNGAASVLGSVGSLLIAMNYGYSATILCGTVLYLGAVPLALQLGREGRR